MRIAVIGPLEVRADDDAPVAVPGAKERLLLAALAAAAPAVVSTDRIVETVWAGLPPASAHRSLQAHMVRLRSALEPDRPKGSTGRYVVRRGHGYALAVDRADLDALRFGDLAARGRARLAAGAAVEAEALLSAALALWRGEPYADWPDAAFADAERRRLQEARSGALAALLGSRLALGRHGDVLPDLERLVVEEPLREEWWRLLMLALYRAGRQAEALAAGRRVRALLAEELGTAPGPGLRATEAAILAQDPALDRAPESAVAVESAPDLGGTGGHGACPYKGLAAYQPDDAPIFHGRARLVAGLVARLVDNDLLVVSGPSGAGKSSVVRAGLVPVLADGALPGSERWQTRILTVGPDPVDLLAELTGEAPPAEPLVLICDQLEQLWGPGVDAGERRAFLDALLGLLDDDVVERCVAVVRGDHVGQLAEHAAFAERLGAALVLVPPLTDPELREVVAEPARSAGLAVEPELVDAVVDDVLGRAGALPLLSMALVGTWERRHGDRLTLAGYLAAGGVAGALTQSAEAAYTGLDPEGRAETRQLLVRLADTDEGGTLVRRAVPLAELALDGPDGPRRRAVVEAFVGRRLLSVDGDHLDVAHEALLSAWPRLVRWLEDDAAGRAVRRRLAPAALEWAAAGRPPDELYRGARLATALEWGSRPGAPLTTLERDFLDASDARAGTELREARDHVARERRARRRTLRLATGLAAVMVLALVAALLAVRFQRAADARAAEAERNSLVADANRLAVSSAAGEPGDVSLLLAAQGVRLADTPESEDGLLRSLLGHQRAIAIVPLAEHPHDSALGGGGTLFLDDGTRLSAWPVDPAGGRITAPRRVGHWGGWLVAAASPTEDLLVGAGTDIYDHLWVRLMSSDGITRSLDANGEVSGRPFGVAFTGDGRTVRLFVSADLAGDRRGWSVAEFDVADGAYLGTRISGALPNSAGAPVADVGDGGRTAVVYDRVDASVPATLVDLGDGRQVPLQVPVRAPTSTGFRAVGTGAVQMWSDGQVTRYDADGRPVQTFGNSRDRVLDVVLSPDGAWSATVGGAGMISIWDVQAATGQWIARDSFVGHAGDVTKAEITRDGRRLVTEGEDDRVVVWDATPEGVFGTPVGGPGDRRLAGRPQTVVPGRLVAVPTRPVSGSAGNPGTTGVAVTFLDPRTGRVVDDVPVGDIEGYAGPHAVPMVVSPDRRKIAITTGLTTTILDAATRRPIGTRIVLPPRGDVGADGEALPAALVSCLAWTPDSTRLVLCLHGESITQPSSALVMVDATSGEEVRHDAYQGTFDAVALSPDRRTLAVVNLRVSTLGNGGVDLLDPRDLFLGLGATLGVGDVATDVSFSLDGRRLAVTGQSGNLYLVDLTTLEATRHPNVVGAPLVQAEWLPDNRTVVLGSAEGTVSLFDAERGTLRAPPLPGADGRAADVYVMPGVPDELVALSGEFTGRRWPLDPMVWVRHACAVVHRDLTRTEWEQYLPDRPYRRTCSDLG